MLFCGYCFSVEASSNSSISGCCFDKPSSVTYPRTKQYYSEEQGVVKDQHLLSSSILDTIDSSFSTSVSHRVIEVILCIQVPSEKLLFPSSPSPLTLSSLLNLPQQSSTTPLHFYSTRYTNHNNTANIDTMPSTPPRDDNSRKHSRSDDGEEEEKQHGDTEQENSPKRSRTTSTTAGTSGSDIGISNSGGHGATESNDTSINNDMAGSASLPHQESNSEEQPERVIYIQYGERVNDPNLEESVYEPVDTWSDEVMEEDNEAAQGYGDYEDEAEDNDDDDFEAEHDLVKQLEKKFYLNLHWKESFNSLQNAIRESELYQIFVRPRVRSYKLDNDYVAKRLEVFGVTEVRQYQYSNSDTSNDRYYLSERDYLANQLIMQEIMLLLKHGHGLTQRGLYYTLKGRLSQTLQTEATKENFDTRINLICNIAGRSRSELNIIVPSKSSVKGPMILEREEETFHNIPYGNELVTVVRLKERIDFRSKRQPLNHLIVNDFLGVDAKEHRFHPRVHKEMKPVAVLIVETEAEAETIDSSLLLNPTGPNDVGPSSLEKIPVMVVCNRGSAPFYSRFFVRRMTRGPFYALALATGDVGPQGFKLIQSQMRPMRYNKDTCSFAGRETELVKLDKPVIAIGPFARDVKRQIEKDESFRQHLQEWKDSDTEMLASISYEGNKYAFINVGVANDARSDDMKLMRNDEIKCEAESFDNIVSMLYRRIKAILEGRRDGRDGWKGKYGM